jgi:hypothetical protein
LITEFKDDNGRPLPAWHQLTAGVAVSSSSEGNSNLNVAVLKESLPIESLAQLGGGITDNASDATATTLKTFDKVLELLQPDQRTINGVDRRPIIFTDPYHNDNLAVGHLSKAAFGDTDRGNYNLVHHRQFMQSLYDIVTHDKELAQSIMDDLAEGIKLKVVRERKQRWLVNQLMAGRTLEWIRHTLPNGKSLLVEWALTLAVRTNGKWVPEQAKHVARMAAMPTIEFALQVEAESGEWYGSTMAWHSRPGRLATRAGFRMFDIHRFYTRFVLPWWELAFRRPHEAFPRSFTVLHDKILEADRNRKHDQLISGIRSGHAEVVKMLLRRRFRTKRR